MDCLALLRDQKKENVLKRIVTCDEKWVNTTAIQAVKSLVKESAGNSQKSHGVRSRLYGGGVKSLRCSAAKHAVRNEQYVIGHCHGAIGSHFEARTLLFNMLYHCLPDIHVVRVVYGSTGDCFVSMSTMSQRSHLTDSEAWRVFGRLEGGQTQAEVAQAIGVSQSVISRIWNRFLETGRAGRRP
ncbi:hypothetical protein TNCV_2033531 [Trichonephila clavipes]|nr:hypothetical protein TNCV_2033531 [Trichonephila clavipes]